MASPLESATAERQLINYLDRLEEEAIIRQDETPLKEADLNLRFMRGNQWPLSDEPGSPFRADSANFRFTLNLMGQIVKRKTALITDSRPTIDVRSRKTGQTRTAHTFEAVAKAVWDENSADQLFMRELVRACAIGSSCCVPVWDDYANFGAGMIRLLMYDPRSCRVDPSITKAVDVQSKAEFFQVREVVPLNFVREHYPNKGRAVNPSVAWSSYTKQPPRLTSSFRGIHSPQSPVAGPTPWRRRNEESFESASPRCELRHSWIRDWVRDERGAPMFGRPRIIRYAVDAEGVVLKDERLAYRHGQIPAHLFDWDVELEHPYGIPEISGLRRIQWTLNRIVGQIMDNILSTNRTRIIADSDALDPKTWQHLLGQNPNGIAIRKRSGRQFSFDVPQNAIPPFIMNVVQMLMGAVDVVSGMTEVMRGQTKQGGATSAIAIDSLQIAAQSVIRMEARAFENWLERIFQQVLALIWQYMTTNRLLHLVGPGPNLAEFAFSRTEFIRRDDGMLMDADTAWQDFVFKVMPGSSLAMTRIQKGVMAANLYQMGLLPGEDVLIAAEWPNPDETVKRAREEMQQGLGPGARTSRKMQKMPGSNKRQAVGV